MALRHILIGLALAVLAYGSDPARAEEAASALDHYERGAWQEAVSAYRQLAETNPDSYEAHVMYQAAYARAGGDKAILTSWYDELCQKAPEDLALKLHRLRLDAPEDRMRDLKDLAKDHGTNCSVHLEIGRAALAEGNATKAVSALKKATALASGGRRDVVLLYAEALVLKDRHAEAAKALRNAVQADATFHQGWVALGQLYLEMGKAQEAREAADSALLIRGRSVPGLLLHAQAADKLGDLDTALKSAGTAHRLAPKLPATSTALADYAGKQEAEGALVRAKELYEAALAIDEEFPGALHGLGWVHERNGDYEAAEKLYRTLHAVRPSDPEPANSVGWCLYKRGRITEAQVFFKKAMDLDDDFVPAIANLGMTYDKRRQYSKAIKLYEKVLKKKGHEDDLRIILNCAFDHESLGSFRKAVKLFERAHKIDPKNAQIMIWLGDDWYFQKKWKRSRDWYEKAANADPKSFDAWRGLAFALMQLRKWDEAAAALESAVKLKEDEQDLVLVLGDLYLDELNDDKKALETYKLYVARGGDSPEVEELIAELEARVK